VIRPPDAQILAAASTAGDRRERSPDEVFDRRGLLRGAVRVAAYAGLAGVGQLLIEGCATYIRPIPKVVYPGWTILLSGLDVREGTGYPASFPPGMEILVDARAKQLGVGIAPNVTATAAAQAAALAVAIDEPQARKRLVVIQAVDPRDMAPRARAAIAAGVDVISYLQPLSDQTAAITADPASLGALLATDAAAWARDHGGTKTVLFVSDATLAAPGSAPVVERAIRAVLARLLPHARVKVVGTPADAFAELASAGGGIVLCSTDYDAGQLGQALRAHRPPEERARLYVGGVGSPSVGPGSLAELGADDVVRGLATVRQRDLTAALVDFPAGLILRGARPHDIRVAPILLRPRSKELADYARANSLTGPTLGVGTLGTVPDLPSLEAAQEHEDELRREGRAAPHAARRAGSPGG
jgi:hypothetical protein